MASNFEKVILACMVLCCLMALVRCEDEEQDVAGQSVLGNKVTKCTWLIGWNFESNQM